MKFLTIRQPWAELIARGVKTIETRSWSTTYRGPLAIHAGLAAANISDAYYAWCATGISADGMEATRFPGRDRGSDALPLGAVVAVCDLIDVVPIVDAHLGWQGDSDTPERAVVHDDHLDSLTLVSGTRRGYVARGLSDQLPFGDFTPGRYAWLLDNVRPLDHPVPMKGAQGLRDLPPDIAAAITRALTEGATRCLT